MLGEVKAAHLHGGLVVETTLDPARQPFLFDHRIDGIAVLPGVMGIEAFAELASVLCPGFHLAAVEDVGFLLPFKFFRDQPAALHLSASASPGAVGEVVVSASLRSVVKPRPELPAQERLHFQARLKMRREGTGTPRTAFRRPAAASLGIGRDAIYGVYFHGPAYQVIERAVVEDDRAVALMTAGLPANVEPPDAESLAAPRLLELCFQAAGLWLLERKQTMALPTALGRAVVFRQEEDAQGRRLFATVQPKHGGESFDARVVDEKGHVYVELEGYRTVALPGTRQLRT
jgi:hypothetical protein